MFDVIRASIKRKVNITEEELETSLRNFKLVETKKGEILLSKGQISNYIYFVNKGYLRIFCIQEDGKVSTRYMAFEGNFGTSLPSFVCREESEAFIDTPESSTLLAIHYNDFQRLLEASPSWEKGYRLFLEKEYIASIKRVESFITMDAKERYQYLLQKEPHIIQRLPNGIVASYMGISQETLSRLKGHR